MIQSLYTAATAMSAQQTGIDVIANNLANVNTPGFQSSRADFADAFYAQMDRTIQSQPNQNLGYGALVAALQRNLTPGALQNTGNPLDLMISGDGYFTVSDGRGGQYYTRNGALSLSTEDGRNYLTTGEGCYLLDRQGQRISVAGADGLSVGEDGVVRQNGAVVATIGLVTFANRQGLASAGGSMFTATAASGQPMTADGKVLQGYQEGSNVDMAEEMTRLIRAQKAYSVLARAISTADQMQSVANSIGR